MDIIKPFKVLMLNGSGEDGRLDLRQTPKGKGLSKNGKYQFFINEDIKNPDFLIVRGKSLRNKKEYFIAKENTVLLTSEPYQILSYTKNYCKQFGRVYSCQERLKLDNVYYSQAMLPWFVGVSFNKFEKNRVNFNYEDIKYSNPSKEKLISVITSNKAFTKGHQERINFVSKLKNYYGDNIDIYGRGFNDFDDKWETLAPYKYQIVIENSSSKYYWTEKISDCFLTQTLPIYYGCTNIDDYFPERSNIKINIHDFDSSVNIINSVIDNDEYSKRVNVLEKCKDLVLNKYNLFDFIASFLDEMNPYAIKDNIIINPASHYVDFHNIYLHTISHSLFKIKQLFNIGINI